MDKTKKEISRFILSGILAVLTDTFVYYILSHFIDLSLAKGISFLTGTITAYLMNKYYTFEQKRKSIKEVIKFLLLYLVSLAANVGVNKVCLLILPSAFSYISFLNNFQAVKLFSFLCATGTSTIINFSGQKFWVFKGK